MTQIFLTPHMYIDIDTTKISRLKNADALRIQTLYKMGYIASPIQTLVTSKNLEKYGITPDSFFTQASQVQTQWDIQKRKLLLGFRHQEVYQIPGTAFLQKYASLFLNIEKKKVYYSNEILKQYLVLLDAQKYEISQTQDIHSLLEKLAEIDPSSAQEMQDI